MIQTASPVNGLNRGIAINSVKLDLGNKHTEANSILQVMGPQEHYLGLIKLWNQYQILNTPLLAATELSNNILYTNTLGETISYSVPVKFSLPFTKDDINEGEKIGLGGEKFYLILNTGRYTKSDILTYDFENGKQAVVNMDEPENPTAYGTDFLYVMNLTDEDPKAYISRRFVQPGVEWVKVTNFKTEWSTENSTINNDSDGVETLMFKTSEVLQSIEHWMTGFADIIDYQVGATTGGVAGMDASVMKQHANPHDVAIQYLFNTLGDPRDPNNPDKKRASVNGGPGVVPNSGSWMPMIMKMLYQEQAKMQERNLMYNQGGVATDARGTKVRLGMGYYPQLKESGNYHTISKPEQLMPLLRQISGDLFFGRNDLPVNERRIKWKVGQGALIEAHKYFIDYFKKDVMFPIWGQHKALEGMLTGDNMNLRYEGIRFEAVMMPECGWIEVEHDPALDWMGTKNQTSFIGGYSTKSYRVFVEDLTNSNFSNAMPPGGVTAGDGFSNGGNITMIKPKKYAQTYTSFQVGTYCPDFLKAYVGAGANAHIASSNKFGFSVQMNWCGEIWLKDPSRSILVEMADPLQTL